MKAIGYFALLFLTMSLISCSSGTKFISNGGAAAVSAPGTIAGKTYRVTVESGSGGFATTGTFTIDFLSDQPIYTTKGDGVNIDESWGMYTYSSSGASGTVEVESGTIKVKDYYAPNTISIYSFTFNTAISGTYVATTTEDVNSRQSGTFTER
ncbi:MAG: hypothetical protein HKN34_00765 [Gammaproteobacteria bacterium]|nr:hypothetical protein [Gammaproteobacteria bacterium]